MNSLTQAKGDIRRVKITVTDLDGVILDSEELELPLAHRYLNIETGSHVSGTADAYLTLPENQ